METTDRNKRFLPRLFRIANGPAAALWIIGIFISSICPTLGADNGGWNKDGTTYTLHLRDGYVLVEHMKVPFERQSDYRAVVIDPTGTKEVDLTPFWRTADNDHFHFKIALLDSGFLAAQERYRLPIRVQEIRAKAEPKPQARRASVESTKPAITKKPARIKRPAQTKAPARIKERAAKPDKPSGKVPVVVAIVDTPVDIDHDMLAPIVDRSAMGKLTVIDENGRKSNLLDLNTKRRRDLEEGFRRTPTQAQIELLDATDRNRNGATSGFEKRRFAELLEMARQGYHDPDSFNGHMSLLGTYFHGTHNAGLIAQSIEDSSHIRLVVFPDSVGTLQGDTGVSDPAEMERSYEKSRLGEKAWVDAISENLKRGKIKVVNLSKGCGLEPLLDRAMKAYPRVLRQPDGSMRLYKAVEKVAKSIYEDFQRLFKENPDTVFVLPAGNDGSRLDHGSVNEYHTGTLRAPNLVVVGATMNNDKLKSQSNYGPKYVDVAAPGFDLPSAQANGGIIHLGGTSEAAPVVAGLISGIRYNHPELSAEQTIAELLSNNTHSSPSLKEKIAKGRYLSARDCFRLGFDLLRR